MSYLWRKKRLTSLTCAHAHAYMAQREFMSAYCDTVVTHRTIVVFTHCFRNGFLGTPFHQQITTNRIFQWAEICKSQMIFYRILSTFSLSLSLVSLYLQHASGITTLALDLSQHCFLSLLSLSLYWIDLCVFLRCNLHVFKPFFVGFEFDYLYF